MSFSDVVLVTEDSFGKGFQKWLESAPNADVQELVDILVDKGVVPDPDKIQQVYTQLGIS